MITKVLCKIKLNMHYISKIPLIYNLIKIIIMNEDIKYRRKIVRELINVVFFLKHGMGKGGHFNVWYK